MDEETIPTLDPAGSDVSVAASSGSLAYPDSFPTNEIRDVIKTIQTGNFARNAPGFAKDGWIIIGYGLGQTVGEPTDAPASKSFHAVASENTANTLDNASAVRALQTALDANQAEAEGKMTAVHIPWQQIIGYLAPIILKILTGI